MRARLPSPLATAASPPGREKPKATATAAHDPPPLASPPQEVEAHVPERVRQQLARLRPQVGSRSDPLAAGPHTFTNDYTHTHTNTQAQPTTNTHTRPSSLPQLYCIDATSVAKEVGLGRRTNMVMQAAFFALSGVMPLDKVCGEAHLAGLVGLAA